MMSLKQLLCIINSSFMYKWDYSVCIMIVHDNCQLSIQVPIKVVLQLIVCLNSLIFVYV